MNILYKDFFFFVMSYNQVNEDKFIFSGLYISILDYVLMHLTNRLARGLRIN